MALEVRPVRTRTDLRRFLSLPDTLHANDKGYSPLLREDFARSLSLDNPLWKDGRGERELLVAWDDGRPVGRVLAHVHHASNSLHNEKAGFFGYLECADEVAVARALIDAASAWHRVRGLELIRGPYDMTITQCIGAVVQGFDEPPSFNQSWNAPHLPRLLEALGFTIGFRCSTFVLDDVSTVDPDSILGPKQRALLADGHVSTRPFDLKQFDRDAQAMTELLNESFAKNYGYVPLSQPEIQFITGPMKRIMRPELTTFIEYDKKPVGVMMVLPDFNVLFRKMKGRLFPFGWAQFLLGAGSLDRAVLQFMGTSSAFQGKGLMRVVMAEAIRALQRAGFKAFDCTWIGQVNAASRSQVKAVGMREKHQLALFSRSLL